ncbi:MAG: DUF2284 domain-containing protein [Eubacteriales bacterium]|nr:DUF2284 domain-containing protein [Eubacteriales bacterium]
MLDKREIIEQTILEYPICEYTFGEIEQIPFSDKVWFICETDCKRYGHSWACPPYCGDIHESIRLCKTYQHCLVFSTVTEVSNSWDQEACLKVKHTHEEITRNIHADLSKRLQNFYVLSTGCTACEQCGCPKEPCRHPESRLPSMESHGIVILQLTDELGLSHSFGNDTIVYFSMILF